MMLWIGVSGFVWRTCNVDPAGMRARTIDSSRSGDNRLFGLATTTIRCGSLNRTRGWFSSVGD